MTAVEVADLREWLSRLLAMSVLTDADASALVAYMIDAEACGRKSHGLQRLPALLDQLSALPRSPRVSTRTLANGVWVVEADAAPGIVAAQRAVDIVTSTDRAGPAIVAVTGFAGTTGALGYFTAQAAKAGFVCAALVCCDSGVAPAGGIDPVLGTNPLAVSFPVPGEPVTIDISTAAVSYGTLQILARTGGLAPPGTVVDQNGQPSSDPGAATRGAQLPMSGHKGYGLGLIIELLAGPMIGAKAGRFAVLGGDGLLMVAAPINLFRDGSLVAAESLRLLDEVRGSRPADEDKPVRIPGERSGAARRETISRGTVEVEAEILARLRR